MNKNKLRYNNINVIRKQHTVMFNFKTHHHSRYSLHRLTSSLVYKNLSLHIYQIIPYRENYVTITNVHIRGSVRVLMSHMTLKQPYMTDEMATNDI